MTLENVEDFVLVLGGKLQKIVVKPGKSLILKCVFKIEYYRDSFFKHEFLWVLKSKFTMKYQKMVQKFIILGLNFQNKEFFKTKFREHILKFLREK